MRKSILIAGVILALIGIIITSIAAPLTEARHLTCPECGGSGKVGWWPFEKTCPQCGGTGYITEAVMVGVGGSVLGFGLAVLGVIVMIIGVITKSKGIVKPQSTDESSSKKEITPKIDYFKKMLQKKCPQCEKPVQKKWQSCPFCGSPLTPQKPKWSKCPNCNSEVDADWDYCPECDTKLK